MGKSRNLLVTRVIDDGHWPSLLALLLELTDC